MARNERAMLALGLVPFCTGVVVLLLAFVLGLSIEGTPQALADAAKAQRMAVPAAVAVIAGVVSLSGRRRNWAFAVGWVAVAAAAVAVLFTVVLPGG